MQNENKSDVARLVQQVQDEHTSGKLGLEGLAEGVSQHQFITRKMERMAADIAQIIALAGEEKARETLMGLQ